MAGDTLVHAQWRDAGDLRERLGQIAARRASLDLRWQPLQLVQQQHAESVMRRFQPSSGCSYHWPSRSAQGFAGTTAAVQLLMIGDARPALPVQVLGRWKLSVDIAEGADSRPCAIPRHAPGRSLRSPSGWRSRYRHDAVEFAAQLEYDRDTVCGVLGDRGALISSDRGYSVGLMSTNTGTVLTMRQELARR